MPDPNAPDLQDLAARTSRTSRAGKPRRLARPIGIAAVVLLIVVGAVVGVALARSDRHTVTPGELTLDQYKISNGSYLLALREGTLDAHVVRHTACLSIQGMPIIWPHGLVSYRQRSGLVLIRDDSGKEIARSGEVVELGGASLPFRQFHLPPTPCITSAGTATWGAGQINKAHLSGGFNP